MLGTLSDFISGDLVVFLSLCCRCLTLLG